MFVILLEKCNTFFNKFCFYTQSVAHYTLDHSKIQSKISIYHIIVTSLTKVNLQRKIKFTIGRYLKNMYLGENRKIKKRIKNPTNNIKKY